MSTLQDPTKPAGHLVEVRENGSALRNDGVELTPASQNPWYELATVYGEFEDGYDTELAAKNRRIWNGWACAGKSDEERAKLAKLVNLPAEELTDLTSKEQSVLQSTFEARMQGAVEIPSHSNSIVMSATHFAKRIVMEKYVFNQYAYFKSAVFNEDVHLRSTAFNDNVSFSSVSFSKNCDFHSSAITGYTYLQSAVFNGDGCFSSAVFNGYVFLQSTVFRTFADFRSTVFNDVAKFSSVKFLQDANFTDSKISFPSDSPTRSAIDFTLSKDFL